MLATNHDAANRNRSGFAATNAGFSREYQTTWAAQGRRDHQSLHGAYGENLCVSYIAIKNAPMSVFPKTSSLRQNFPLDSIANLNEITDPNAIITNLNDRSFHRRLPAEAIVRAWAMDGIPAEPDRPWPMTVTT